MILKIKKQCISKFRFGVKVCKYSSRFLHSAFEFTSSSIVQIYSLWKSSTEIRNIFVELLSLHQCIFICLCAIQ